MASIVGWSDHTPRHATPRLESTGRLGPCGMPNHPSDCASRSRSGHFLEAFLTIHPLTFRGMRFDADGEIASADRQTLFPLLLLVLVGSCEAAPEPLGPVDATTGGGTSAGETGARLDQLDTCLDPAREPLSQLPRIVDGAIEQFATNSMQLGRSGPSHRCPTADGEPRIGPAVSPVVPPTILDCARYPDGTCTPIPDASQGGAGRYLIENWGVSPFFELGFSMTEPHRFHYQFNVQNAGSGYGACRFTAMAFGNLDGDFNLLSTYRVVGELSQDGAEIGPIEWTFPCR